MNHPIQREIRGLVERFEHKVNVDKDDHRLSKLLGKGLTRKLRSWCGDYFGSDGKLRSGRVPSGAHPVRAVFEVLLAAADPSRRTELSEELDRVCALVEPLSATPCPSIVSMRDTEAIVRTLASLMAPKENGEVQLDVVTRSVEDHSTVMSCMGLMLVELKTLARKGGLIRLRIIERMARIDLLPADNACPGVAAHVRSVGNLNLLSWHGSLVATIKDGRRIPVGGMFGYDGNYHIRETPSADMNIKRELEEKLADFDRAWTTIPDPNRPPRMWGVAA